MNNYMILHSKCGKTMSKHFPTVLLLLQINNTTLDQVMLLTNVTQICRIGSEAHLILKKFKVALNLSYGIILKFAKSCILMQCWKLNFDSNCHLSERLSKSFTQKDTSLPKKVFTMIHKPYVFFGIS